MNRRGFLGLLGVSAATSVIPKELLAKAITDIPAKLPNGATLWEGWTYKHGPIYRCPVVLEIRGGHFGQLTQGGDLGYGTGSSYTVQYLDQDGCVIPDSESKNFKFVGGK